MVDAVDAAGELAALFPLPVEFVIAERKIAIPVSGIRHCSQVVAQAMALAAQFGPEDDELIFIDEHPGLVAAVLTFALPDVDADWIIGLDAIEKFDLALAWWQVNQDFFVRRLQPARKRLRNVGLPESPLTVGPTSSIGSNAQDTPAPTTTRLKVRGSTSRPLIARNGASATPA